MGHRTVKSGYQKLADRLNKFPQGAPPSEYLYEIFSVLMSEREAQVMSLLPIRPFTSVKASRALKVPIRDAEKILHELASRALLLDVEHSDGEIIYTLPPPMAGFFEFSLMRTRDDCDQKLLSELFYQYLNVEESFVKDLFVSGETKLGRILVNEQAVDCNPQLHILDYERSSEMLKKASTIGVGMCYCRHKMHHVGKACHAPLENICMTLGNTAQSLIRKDYARKISVSQAMEILETAYEHNLVQIGENEQEHMPFICNCCSCCCEALLAIRRFGTMNTINTTNFLPKVFDVKCSGCGLCIAICPVGAITLAEAVATKAACIDEALCLGCGLCVKVCSKDAMELENREKRAITPVNSVHRIVLSAIEKDKLHHLIFDNQAHLSHRTMAAVLGAILKMPPIKRMMASKQMKSRYLASLIRAASR